MSETVTHRDGLVQWRPEGTTDLATLTSQLNGALDAAQEDNPTSVLLIHLPLVDESSSWPRGSVLTEDVNRWERALFRLERSLLVSVAVVDGSVGGAAFDLLLACSVRLATPGSSVQLAINEGQLWPGMGLFRFTREAGVAGARRYLLWKTELDVATLETLNLVDHVTPSIESTIDATIELIGTKDATDVARRWALVREGGVTLADEVLGLHLAACDRELRRVNKLTTSS